MTNGRLVLLVSPSHPASTPDSVAAMTADQLRAQLSEALDEEIRIREEARIVELVPARADEARRLFRTASELAERRFEVIRWLLGLS